MSVEFINRPPRIQPDLPEGEFEIPGPPESEKKQNAGIMHALLPMVTIVGYVVVSATGQGRNLALIIPMALSVVASTVFAFISYQKQQNAGEDEFKVFEERLADMRRDMVADHDRQRIFYLYNYPSPETLLKIASGEESSRSGTRLWERRPSDPDFGMIRLGIGTRPSTVIYVPADSNTDSGNPRMQDVLKLASDSEFVTEVPVTIALRPDPTLEDEDAGGEEEPIERAVLEPRHAIGIAGENRAKVSDVVRAMAVHFAAFHAPIDARLHVIGTSEARSRWEWAMWLPHTNTRNERYVGDNMTFDESQSSAFWDALYDELDKRQLRLQDKDDEDTESVKLPFLLVIVDQLEAPPGTPLADAQSEAAASLIMQRGQELGAAIIFMVTEASQIPTDCQAVIEVEPIGAEVAFRYAEVGLNTNRFIGTADTLDRSRAEREFAQLVKDYAVRRSFADDITTYIDLLEMNNYSRLEEIPISDYWEQSLRPENADWIKVPLGVMGGNKIRTLYMSQDYDGVHGMIAGTTGSGKSELLLTLIAGIAINYDPRVINLALVDYKGGSAFEPFRELPHCVDIVTNLEGNAVDRMFVAIKAELDRRSKILTDYNVKHIVEYRKKGYHLKEPFPHLFIIVDEFAEMVAENAEYKARFDSITRLGRAIGVSLILATQRPSGAVTDQMRANMKYKICLRVETTEDSRELLRRSDAAFLPSNLPGRAFMQVGNENLELMQVARAGGGYSADEEVILDDVIWLDDEQELPEAIVEHVAQVTADLITREQLEQAAEAVQGETEDLPSSTIEPSNPYNMQAIADAINGRPETMVDWVVGMAGIASQRDGVPVQAKPWPDPLPERLPINLPIDATYLNTDQAIDNTLILSPAVARWLDEDTGWEPVDWRDRPLSADIGIVDNPYASEQRLLNVDLTRGPLVLFGAPGWGKTTFLRTMMIALAARHSPRELHMYALDFGKGGLNVLKALPHLGASIDSTEEQRVERLIRMLGSFLEQRRSKITAYGSLAAYNAENPDDLIPGVLVLVDNFGEFKENYEDKLPTLISLVRDGRAFGIYFAITASQTSDVPAKLYNLFTERFSLKLPDPSEYTGIVGRGAPNFNDVPGRGVVNINRNPLEFQCGLPLVRRLDELADGDEGERFEELALAMDHAWTEEEPEAVEILPELILLRDLLPKIGTTFEALEPIIGLNDLDRKPTHIDLEKLGPHFVVTGPPLSGKTTTLRTWALSIAHCYGPQQVMMVLVDTKRTLFNYGGELSLGNLPQVVQTVSESEEAEEFIRRLSVEFDAEKQQMIRQQSDTFRPEDDPDPAVVIIIDNYDEFATIAGRKGIDDLSELARKYGSQGLHIIIGNSLSGMRSRDELIKQVESPRYTLVLQDVEAVRNTGGKVPYALVKGEYPPGRGFVVKSVRVALSQIATPYNEVSDSVEEVLDEWVQAIQVEHWPTEVQWRYHGPAELLEEEKLEEIGAGPTRAPIPEMSEAVQKEFIQQLKEMGIDPKDVLGESESE